MDTPICDFVKAYRDRAAVRGHMPGHKGKALLGAEPLDITEIDGADVLYHADGIIRKSEENASRLFGTAKTVYSAEGSSLSIRAMLYLVKRYAAEHGEKAVILAGRNAHKTFVSAAALLDVAVNWIFPGNGQYLSCDISADRLDALLHSTEKPTAVYITAPDYLGNTARVEELATVCHRHGTLLLVDNAHGAYLNFLPQNKHPMAHGADICCDSAHKTLPVLTGGAYLHISRHAPAFFAEHAHRAMALFASTSPSYLILQSLDAVNPYLAGAYPSELRMSAEKVGALKQDLAVAGYRLVGDEPLKVTLFCKEYGYTGHEIAEKLRADNIWCEFSDPDYLVLMLTPQNGDADFSRIADALKNIKKSTPLPTPKLALLPPVQRVSPHEALMRPSHEVPVAESVGKILATVSVSCPPAVPVVACGEEIGEDAVRLFRYYSIETISVLC